MGQFTTAQRGLAALVQRGGPMTEGWQRECQLHLQVFLPVSMLEGGVRGQGAGAQGGAPEGRELVGRNGLPQMAWRDAASQADTLAAVCRALLAPLQRAAAEGALVGGSPQQLPLRLPLAGPGVGGRGQDAPAVGGAPSAGQPSSSSVCGASHLCTATMAALAGATFALALTHSGCGPEWHGRVFGPLVRLVADVAALVRYAGARGGPDELRCLAETEGLLACALSTAITERGTWAVSRFGGGWVEGVILCFLGHYMANVHRSRGGRAYITRAQPPVAS
jgi:hypothetical protein